MPLINHPKYRKISQHKNQIRKKKELDQQVELVKRFEIIHSQFSPDVTKLIISFTSISLLPKWILVSRWTRDLSIVEINKVIPRYRHLSNELNALFYFNLSKADDLCITCGKHGYNGLCLSCSTTYPLISLPPEVTTLETDRCRVTVNQITPNSWRAEFKPSIIFVNFSLIDGSWVVDSSHNCDGCLLVFLRIYVMQQYSYVFSGDICADCWKRTKICLSKRKCYSCDDFH